jgi:hypothetical protein
MDAPIGGDPEWLWEELLHVFAYSGIPAAVLLDPVGGQTIELGTDVVWPRIGGGYV